jgi:hypothetical protein
MTLEDLCTILQCMSHLKTLILKGTLRGNIVVSSHSIIFKQITSLFVEDCDCHIELIEAFLSLTPALEHLKLIFSAGSDTLLSGKRWEELIQSRLPQLNRVEFFSSTGEEANRLKNKMEKLIASFRTSFWIEDKKWFVNCECDDGNIYYIIDLYTIPICKPSFEYKWPYKKLFLSTFPMKSTLDSIMMDNVDTVNFSFTTTAEQQVS